MTKRRRNAAPEEILISMTLIAGLLVAGWITAGHVGTSYVIMLTGFLVAILAVGAWLILRSIRVQRAYHAIDMAQINTMSGTDFEVYLAYLLPKQGYKIISLTRRSGDFGVDLIVSKNNKRIAVQAKRYSKSVGPAAIQQAVAGMAYYKCAGSMVITNSTFTPAAQSLARSNACELVDAVKLGEWILVSKNTAANSQPSPSTS
jgi:restriction system protein